jgi:hypothetical protein
MQEETQQALCKIKPKAVQFKRRNKVALADSTFWQEIKLAFHDKLRPWGEPTLL